MNDRRESDTYARLGASSSKRGVNAAVGKSGKGFFVKVSDDVCGDPEYYSVIHADGAGTKSIAAYLAYRETSETCWFKSLAQDSLVMNLDDVACIGAFEGLLLSNTIGRNRALVPDEIIAELVAGYRDQILRLKELGINIEFGGGETADLGDLVRTIIIDSTLFARVKKKEAVCADSIAPGDVIVGLSSTGQASYEEKPNSGLGSNGYTLARHALIPHRYVEQYPEIIDPALEREDAYQGKIELFERVECLQGTVMDALLSPTRTYAPVIRKILTGVESSAIHGIIHCTGGGQTKIVQFGKKMKYVKNNLFPCPPVFSLIQETLSVPWSEMYAVFNMGHRLEIICSDRAVKEVIDIASGFGIEGRQVGFVESEDAQSNTLYIRGRQGEFEYRC